MKFHESVRTGDTVYAESIVLEKRESKSRPGQGIILVRTSAKTHDERLVCSFERSILVYGRGQEALRRGWLHELNSATGLVFEIPDAIRGVSLSVRQIIEPREPR